MSKMRIAAGLTSMLLLGAGLLAAQAPPAPKPAPAPAAPTWVQAVPPVPPVPPVAPVAPAPPAPHTMVFAGHSTQGAFLGVGTMPMSPELRAHFGAPEERGVLVDRVEPGSAAEAAGVKVGDVLTALEDEPVADGVELLRAVRQHEPGAKVRVALVRDRKPLTVEAKLGDAEGQRQVVRIEREIRRSDRGPVVECPEGCVGVAIDVEWAERLAEEIERGLNRPEIERHLRIIEQKRPELEERLRELEERLVEMEKKLHAAEKGR